MLGTLTVVVIENAREQSYLRTAVIAAEDYDIVRRHFNLKLREIQSFYSHYKISTTAVRSNLAFRCE